MKLELLAGHIETLGLGTIGKDLFVHHMNGDVRQGILLRVPLSGVPIDHELPDYFRAEVQVIVRAQNQAAGSTLAARLLRELSLYKVTLTDGVTTLTINQMLPKTKPIVYPRSESNGMEWSINFACSYVER